MKQCHTGASTSLCAERGLWPYPFSAPASHQVIDPAKPSLVLEHYPKLWSPLFCDLDLLGVATSFDRFFVGLLFVPAPGNDLAPFVTVKQIVDHLPGYTVSYCFLVCLVYLSDFNSRCSGRGPMYYPCLTRLIPSSSASTIARTEKNVR